MMTERERAHPSFHDLTSAKQRLDDRNDDHSNTRKAILKTIIHQYIMTDVLCFDFGMLCKNCNTSLPTENRLQFLDNITRYIKGKV